MRGFRFGVVVLVALALFFNEMPLDARGAPPRDFSTSQTLRSWDGRGLAIPGPSASVEDSRAALKKLGGTWLILKADTERLRRDLLSSAQDDLRRVMRDTRAGYKAITIQDGEVKIQLRNEEDVPRALVGIAGSPVQSGKGLGGSVEVHNLGAGLIALKLVQKEVDERVDASIVQAVEIFSIRIKELGLEYSSVRRIGPDRIEILLPGQTQPRSYFQHLYSHAQLSFRLIESTNAIPIPTNRSAEAELLHSHKTKAAYLVQKRIVVHGHDLRSATALLDPRTRMPVVAFKLGGWGSQQLAKGTRENAGRSLGIVLDHELFAAPLIRSPIEGGMAKIQGNFSIQDALDLARILRFGILPSPLLVAQEETVAPAKQ